MPLWNKKCSCGKTSKKYKKCCATDAEKAEREKSRAAAPPAAEVSDGGRAARRKLKKKRKRCEKGVAGAAADYFDIYGPGARAELEVHTDRHFKHGQTALRVKDVQGLLTWVLGEGQSPAWAFVKNKPLCQRVLLLTLEGVDADTWRRHQAGWPKTCAAFPAAGRVPVRLPKFQKGVAVGAAAVLRVPEVRAKAAKVTPAADAARVSKTPSWTRSWTNFSLL
jgi:hypothetical protein